MNARQLYAEALGKLPQLSADEQLEIARRYVTGHDPRDAERLVVANLRLVVKLACELGKRSPIELMDLVQGGTPGSSTRSTSSIPRAACGSPPTPASGSAPSSCAI
jgi:DNA-directed RNA polymerase sigma subunit (sigma70/sigma32)